MGGPPPSPRATSIGLVQDRVGPCLKCVRPPRRSSSSDFPRVEMAVVTATAGADRVTIEEVVTKVLMDDPADVIRGSVRWVAPCRAFRQPLPTLRSLVAEIEYYVGRASVASAGAMKTSPMGSAVGLDLATPAARERLALAGVRSWSRGRRGSGRRASAGCRGARQFQEEEGLSIAQIADRWGVRRRR
jgi:hypothetical protein